MHIHDVTELIWHFVGHLRLDQDAARDRIQYEDAASERVLDDARFGFGGDARILEELEEMASREVNSRMPGGPKDPNVSTSPGSAGDSVWIDIDIAAAKSLPAVKFAAAMAGVASGGVSSYLVKRDFDPEPRQTVVDLRQLNRLDDDDYFSSGPAWTGELPAVQSTPPLDELSASASSMVPDWLAPLENGNSGDVVAFARGLDGGASPLTSSVEPGDYLNGVRLADGETLPDDFTSTGLGPTGPDMPKPNQGPTGDLGITTQAVEMGSNTAYNGAAIVDANGACGTLIILGDKISLNAIVQVNAYCDDDTINAGGIGTGTVSGDGTQANNLAAWTVRLTNTASDSPSSGSEAPFRVDVVDGDFFDVRALFQTNHASDNDVATLTSSGHYSLVRTGGNELINVANFQDFSFTSYYDVIVVGGSYYDLNMIVQLNVLRDNDAISVSGPGTGDGTVDSGSNSLLNSAKLIQYGTDDQQALSDSMKEYVESLKTESPSGASSGWQFSDGGDGYIDVLYVTGDYFDINCLWQTNIVSDVDVAALQTDNSGTSTTQVVSTGANSLQNEAIIVDVGALDTEYVGGAVYEGSTLIQANLIESNDDDIVVHDTQMLNPAVIAFIGTTSDASHSDPSNVWLPPSLTDNGLSGMDKMLV
ncbi:MAG: hypothetical protein HC900_06165 [Methylacidiphilales bacterium]|nr:hypothetical protein [Candidatus Methylacidiphilales bacterium]